MRLLSCSYNSHKNNIGTHLQTIGKTLDKLSNPSLIADNKKFWKTVKPLFSGKISHRDIISLTEDGKTITEDLQIAEIFNNYFSNVIRSLCDRNVPTEPGIACSQNTVSTAIQQSINSEIIPASSLLIKTWRK